MEYAELAVALRRFATDRDWEQFHSPKNLVMALTGEVGELAEVFQWMTEEASKDDPGVLFVDGAFQLAAESLVAGRHR